MLSVAIAFPHAVLSIKASPVTIVCKTAKLIICVFSMINSIWTYYSYVAPCQYCSTFSHCPQDGLNKPRVDFPLSMSSESIGLANKEVLEATNSSGIGGSMGNKRNWVMISGLE